MKTRVILSMLISAFFLFSCSNYDHGEFTEILKKLEGEWEEAPGVGYREVWKPGKNGLTGAGFMHSGETFSQTEKLAIVIKDSSLVYQATVPDQNEGRTIPFYLQSYSDKSLEFVNNAHDFPNVIAYRFFSDTVLHIKVQSLTDTSRNFSLRLTKNMDH